MTPDELAAIRARDAAGDTTIWDARALLAEVDRLTADLADTAAYAALGRENERARIRAVVEGLPRLWANRITSTGMESVSVASVECVERAAVLAAIDGKGGNATVTAGVAVGFAQAGGEPPLGGIEQFQDEDR